VIVVHEERRLEVWRRAGDVFTRDAAGAGQTLRLESLAIALAVDDVLRDPLA
jgi:hypothetical protein